MDVNAYLQDLYNIDWSFLEGEDVEMIWQAWKTNVKKEIDRHTKQITIKENKKSCAKPWIHNQLKSLIRKKQAAEIRKDYFPGADNASNLRLRKNELNMAMFKAKKNFYHNKIEENTTNPRKLWAIMRDIAPSNLKSKGRQISVIPADTFAKQFTNACTVDAATVIPATRSELQNSRGIHFELTPCTEAEILKIVNNINTNKADGIDGIPIKCIKLGIAALVTPITKLVNIFMVKGFPMELKRAIVIPIYKKGKVDNPSNYRPISLLPGISKIAERAIADKLSKYLQENRLLSSTQHGFRQNHSTNTGLLQITEQIRKDMDNGKGIGLVALDLSKAFDTVTFAILQILFTLT